MDKNISVELFKYEEDLENISLQLNHLQNGAENLSDYIEQMQISPDVHSCFEIIRYAIAGVKQSVDERIEKIAKDTNNKITPK